MARDFDTQWSWSQEKEPSFTGRPRPVIPLSANGTLRTYIERRTVTRCSVCERPCQGDRCESCVTRGCQRVECECGYLAAGERCGCREAA